MMGFLFLFQMLESFLIRIGSAKADMNASTFSLLYYKDLLDLLISNIDLISQGGRGRSSIGQPKELGAMIPLVFLFVQKSRNR